MIGAGPSGGLTSQPFGGTIDEIQVFDRALTAAEIEGIFTAAIADNRYQVTVTAKSNDIERTVSVELVVQD